MDVIRRWSRRVGETRARDGHWNGTQRFVTMRKRRPAATDDGDDGGGNDDETV